MNREEAVQLFAGLLDARKRCEHGDFFYENLEDLCDAAILAYADISEKMLHIQRTREAIQAARLNGKQIGQKPGTKLTTKKSIKAKAIILQHSKDFNGALDDEEVRLLTKVSRNAYYKYKRELREHN